MTATQTIILTRVHLMSDNELDKLKWYAVDLDGCIAKQVWPATHIGDPITENVAKLRAVHREGYKIVIHTSRGWEYYRKIEEWLKDNRIPFKAIVCGKLLVHRYVDDKGINSEAASWL